MNIWIHGPQGCGKSENADYLARHFKMNRIYDDGSNPFESDDTIHLHGNLVISIHSAESVPGFLEVYTYEEALKLADEAHYGS